MLISNVGLGMKLASRMLCYSHPPMYSFIKALICYLRAIFLVLCDDSNLQGSVEGFESQNTYCVLEGRTVVLCLSDLCHSSEWSVVQSLYGNKETLVREARSGMFPRGTVFKGQLESDRDTDIQTLDGHPGVFLGGWPQAAVGSRQSSVVPQLIWIPLASPFSTCNWDSHIPLGFRFS